MRLATKSLTRSLTERWVIPPFLCPAIVRGVQLAAARTQSLKPKPARVFTRCSHVQASNHPAADHPPDLSILKNLPWTCPGCGAYTQTLNPAIAGYYSPTRKHVRAFVAARSRAAAREVELQDDSPSESPQDQDESIPASCSLALGEESENKGQLEVEESPVGSKQTLGILSRELPATPVCDRCHDLLHYRRGQSIIHPTAQSIQDIITESPYKYNHIYHIIDAADFPLSLIPQLHEQLSLMQRSRNRRSKPSKYYHGQKTELSFVITRSDLLAPTKEQVDHLMPYLIQVLRDALGPYGENVRLGNVRCVSSARGWWTKELKEAIWDRGGGGWMVGKVNVGKSSLFENVFPKGRNTNLKGKEICQPAGCETIGDETAAVPSLGPYLTEQVDRQDQKLDHTLEGDSLLPPAPPEIAFPVLPIVSPLPGTTASPIRLPFGNGRGELIDLPGLERGRLETYVDDKHKLAFVMRHRARTEQYVVRPGQSILIGGLIRITPTGSDTMLLACPFVPIKCHVTNTEKAIAIQNQTEPNWTNFSIAKPIIGGLPISSAGTVSVKWDVTKPRAGPLTAKSAIGLKPAILPFQVFGTDVLIEGCGWVELAVQVRKKSFYGSSDEEVVYPSVDVFSPEGKYVGVRRPMNAWVLSEGSRKVGKARPRRSMKGVKKNEKKLARAAMADRAKEGGNG